MAITLGSLVFDATHTTAREKLEEVGGRDERGIEISGLVLGESSAADIEARLDAILDAASSEDYGAELSLRAGRRLWVRREGYSREVNPESLVGSFTLKLGAKYACEEAVEPTLASWSISESGATKALTAGGNLFARPTISLEATGAIVNPSFGDGTRTLVYSGTVADGSVLVSDASEGCVTLDGEDVTPYTEGVFPRISPEGTTLTYTDDAASSHTAAVEVSFRSRWW